MEGAFDHFAAEQPGKDTHAGKEDAQADIVELHDYRKDLCIVLDLGQARGFASVEDDMGKDDEYWNQSE